MEAFEYLKQSKNYVGGLTTADVEILQKTTGILAEIKRLGKESAEMLNSIEYLL